MTPSDAHISASEYRAISASPKKSKYKNKRTVVDGISFDSKAESRYYLELKILERSGQVTSVEMQKPFPLVAPSGQVIGSYRADFSFWDTSKKCQRVIDVKGFDTPLSRWKRKHVKAQYGIEVEIVR
jgi:hypothetical protein